MLTKFQSDFGFAPPADYIEFLSHANGGEGSIGGNSYLALWKIEDMKPRNEGFQVNDFAPGLVLFGSDGGDAAYVFDTGQKPVQFSRVPFIGMDLSEVATIGWSFVEFLEFLRNE
jgi:hypothetical protein